MRVYHDFFATRIRINVSRSGSGSGQMIRIRPDPDPKHWIFYGYIRLFQEFGVPRERAALYDNTIISLPLEQLTTCLSTLPRSALLPTTREIKEAEINELPLGNT